jgi:hypothetical protein
MQFSPAYYYFIPFGTNTLHNAIYILKPKVDEALVSEAETAVTVKQQNKTI